MSTILVIVNNVIPKIEKETKPKYFVSLLQTIRNTNLVGNNCQDLQVRTQRRTQEIVEEK